MVSFQDYSSLTYLNLSSTYKSEWWTLGNSKLYEWWVMPPTTVSLKPRLLIVLCIRADHMIQEKIMGTFFPLNSHPMVYFITWEMHGFPHHFSITWENAAKPIVWGEPGKLVFILFPWYGCFFPIRFPSYGILHNMVNAWVSSSISHSMGKCSKTHWMRKSSEISFRFFHSIGAFFH